MSLSIPPPWLLTLDAFRPRLEQALQEDLGVPVTIVGDPDRAVVTATVDGELVDEQLEQLLDSLAPMWPSALAPWRIGLEVWVDPPRHLADVAAPWRTGLHLHTTVDAGEMAVRASG